MSLLLQTRDQLEDEALEKTSLLQDVKVQLLGKLGRHQEALHILVYVLNDIAKVRALAHPLTHPQEEDASECPPNAQHHCHWAWLF